VSKKSYDKEALIADHKTGAYSQRELAKRHGVSNGTVCHVTKGIPQDSKQLVEKKVEETLLSEQLSAKKIELNQLAIGKTEQELSAIIEAAQFKLDFMKSVQDFGNKAIRKAVDLLEVEETGQGFKAIVEGVDKLTVTHKINERFASGGGVTVNANAQAGVQQVDKRPVKVMFVGQ
jgi:transposase-like protein